MNRLLRKINRLERQLNLGKDNYKQAIRNDQTFEEVKVIYLKIKQLGKEADALMREANQKYQGQRKKIQTDKYRKI